MLNFGLKVDFPSYFSYWLIEIFRQMETRKKKQLALKPTTFSDSFLRRKGINWDYTFYAIEFYNFPILSVGD